MNGYTWPDRRQIAGFQDIKDDGSTACGVWTYTGVFPTDDHNRARSRRPDGPDGPGTHLGWGFAWPANRRTLYNRAAADPAGKAMVGAQKAGVVGCRRAQRWDGQRRGRFRADEAARLQARLVDGSPEGMEAIDGCSPFTMIADGKSSLFVPSGLKDGPLPTHYEPVESPVRNPFHGQQASPVAKMWKRAGQRLSPGRRPALSLCADHLPADRAPCRRDADPVGRGHRRIAARGVRRNRPRTRRRPRHRPSSTGSCCPLCEARSRRRHWLPSGCGRLRLRAAAVHQIGMPWHFGWQGYATGDIANVLTSVVGDANTSIHEGKALTCSLRKGRLRPQ